MSWRDEALLLFIFGALLLFGALVKRYLPEIKWFFKNRIAGLIILLIIYSAVMIMLIAMLAQHYKLRSMILLISVFIALSFNWIKIYRKFKSNKMVNNSPS